MSTYWKDALFGILTGLYSVANARLTVGLPLETAGNRIDAFCMFVVAGIGGIILFRANPNEAVTSIFKRTPKP